MKSGSIVQTSAESGPEKQVIDIVIPVKDGGPMLIDVVVGWLSQELPAGWRMNLIVINDGSVDGVPEKLESQFKDDLTVLHHQKAKGRATACNVGAAVGGGECIAFFDADCIPVSSNVLKNHLEALLNSVALTFGSLEARGDDFWARYLRKVALLREQRFIAGDQSALTTANCVVKRDVFVAAGGFDERYKHYGFEDRDLILRILGLGVRAAFVDNAGVIHSDTLSLVAVTGKMRTAGRCSSTIFATSHPDSYKRMDFYRVDMRYHARLAKSIVRVLCPSLKFVAEVGEFLLRLPLPFRLKSNVVRICSGIAYSMGTSEAGEIK